MNFKSFPELNTERLKLRKTLTSDSDEVLFLRSNKTVNEFIKRPENKQTKNITDALKFIEDITKGIENNELFSWKITLKNDPTMIGSICLWNFSENKKTAEVGYDLNPLFQGKGIMNEALNCVVQFGFDKLNLDKIEAFTHCKNESSKKLLEKNSFNFMVERKDEGNASNNIFVIENPHLS